MAAYGVLYDSFWDGPTGVALRELGGQAAQLCAFYLLKNRQDNMIGLYPLDLVSMRNTIGTLSQEDLERGLIACGRALFAEYDTVTGHIWVRELARYRMGFDRKPLSNADNRALGAAKLYRDAAPNPFLTPFFTKYRRNIPNLKRRTYQGACKGLARVGATPCLSVISTAVDQEDQRTEIKIKSEQKIKIPRAKTARALSALFVAFWKVYPRKVDKDDALSAWWKLFPSGEDGAVVGRIMAALDWQVTQPQWTKDSGQFIPYPASWLNGRRWEDEPVQAGPKADPNAAMWDRIGVR